MKCKTLGGVALCVLICNGRVVIGYFVYSIVEFCFFKRHSLSLSCSVRFGVSVLFPYYLKYLLSQNPMQSCHTFMVHSGSYTAEKNATFSFFEGISWIFLEFVFKFSVLYFASIHITRKGCISLISCLGLFPDISRVRTK